MITKSDIENATPRVLERLKALAELPKTGTVAGQSVASIFFEELGLEGLSGPINDIDVFINYVVPRVERGLPKEKSKNNKTIKINLSRSIGRQEETGYDSYDHVKFIASRNDINLMSTYRVGLINYTLVGGRHCISQNQSDPVSSMIINGFDINSVAVGINLSTGSVLFNDEFIEFLNTRKLKAVSANTPMHTMIRLADKALSGQLKGITCDLDYELELLSSAVRIQSILYDKHGYDSQGKVVLSFGKKYREKALKYKDILPEIKEKNKNNDIFFINVNKKMSDFDKIIFADDYDQKIIEDTTSIEDLLKIHYQATGNLLISNFPKLYRIIDSGDEEKLKIFNLHIEIQKLSKEFTSAMFSSGRTIQDIRNSLKLLNEPFLKIDNFSNRFKSVMSEFDHIINKLWPAQKKHIEDYEVLDIEELLTSALFYTSVLTTSPIQNLSGSIDFSEVRNESDLINNYFDIAIEFFQGQSCIYNKDSTKAVVDFWWSLPYKLRYVMSLNGVKADHVLIALNKKEDVLANIFSSIEYLPVEIASKINEMPFLNDNYYKDQLKKSFNKISSQSYGNEKMSPLIHRTGFDVEFLPKLLENGYGPELYPNLWMGLPSLKNLPEKAKERDLTPFIVFWLLSHNNDTDSVKFVAGDALHKSLDQIIYNANIDNYQKDKITALVGSVIGDEYRDELSVKVADILSRIALNSDKAEEVKSLLFFSEVKNKILDILMSNSLSQEELNKFIEKLEAENGKSSLDYYLGEAAHKKYHDMIIDLSSSLSKQAILKSIGLEDNVKNIKKRKI